LGRESPPASQCLRLSIGRWHNRPPLRLAHRPLQLAQLTLTRFRLWLQRPLFLSLLRWLLWRFCKVLDG
jgi:hypothetical protein